MKKPRYKVTWVGVPGYRDGTAEVIGRTKHNCVQVHWPHGSGGIVAIPADHIIEVTEIP